MSKAKKLLGNGIVEIHEEESLEKKLNSGRKLRIKHGIDPTGPKIHLGRAIQFSKLKKLQDAGHKIVLIIGDFTAQIGDASDKIAARKSLAEAEIRGTDQLFNLLAGRIIQKKFGQQPQDVITFEMLPGLDGRKMSTSWGNGVYILDEPDEMYGKIMSMHDDQIMTYAKLCTDLSEDELGKFKNPRDQKAYLALEIVKLYHGENKAKKAGIEFDRIFKSKDLPSDMDEIKIDQKEIGVIDLFVNNKLVSSRSEAKRLIEQGAVKKIVNNQQSVINNIDEKIKIDDGMVFKIGKRKFVKI